MNRVMKYIIITLGVFFSESVFANSFVAKCQNFIGKHVEHVSGYSESFSLNDGTIYEFLYSSNGSGSLKYVIAGTGVIEPKKEQRWHKLKLLEQSSTHIVATSFEGAEQIQFSLYPKLASAQIIWVTHPTKFKPEPVTLILKANCEFLNE